MKMPISQNVKLKTIFPEAKILEKMSQKYRIIINYFVCLSQNVILITKFDEKIRKNFGEKFDFHQFSRNVIFEKNDSKNPNFKNRAIQFENVL